MAMYRLIINGKPCLWTKETEEEIKQQITVYKRQDKKEGRPQAHFKIVKE